VGRAAGSDRGDEAEVREFVARGGKSVRVAMFLQQLCVCADRKSAMSRNKKVPTEAGLGSFSCSWLLNYNSTFALLQLSTLLLYYSTIVLNYNYNYNYSAVFP